MRLFTGIVALSIAATASAQDVRDADTLPKNVGGLIISPAIGYGPGVERFGPGWGFGRESLIADYNGLSLAEVIGGDVGELERQLGAIDMDGPQGLGVTNFRGTQTSIGINFAAAYGITDRFTIAAFLPFMYANYTLDAWLSNRVDKDGNPVQMARWRVKDSDKLTCPGGDFSIGEDFGQIIERDVNYRFNIGDLRRALVSDCLGYKDPFDYVDVGDDSLYHGTGTRTYSGFRFFIPGANYKLYHGSAIQISAISYLIAPTGKTEDPSDLFDFNFGDGQWDAALLGAVTVPLGDFRFAASGGYEISFGDKIEKRLATMSFSEELEMKLVNGEISEDQLLSEHLDEGTMIPVVTRYDFAEVTRKLGDTVYLYSGLSYQALEWLSFGVTLDFMHHFRDKVTAIGARPEGTRPYYANETEARTAAEAEIAVAEEANGPDEMVSDRDKIAIRRAHLGATEGRRKAAFAWHTVRGSMVAGLGINVNMLGPFLRDEFPIPLIASVSMSRFLAGQNIDTPDSFGLSIILPIPFGDVKDPAEYGYDNEPGRGLPWP